MAARSGDLYDNSCSHAESLNCFGPFGNRPNDQTTSLRARHGTRARRCGASRLDVGPALFLQVHHAHYARLHNRRLGNQRNLPCFSTLLMFSRVLPHALKEISGLLSARASIRAFTGEVSSRSI